MNVVHGNINDSDGDNGKNDCDVCGESKGEDI